MKYIIPVIVFMLFANHSHCQNRDTSKLTAKYIYEDVKAGFTKLVTALEGPAKHTYEVYVIQQRVEALTYLGVVAILFIVAIALLSIGLKRANFKDEQWNRYATISIIGIPFSLAAIVTTICFFASSFCNQLINPEYYAIREIINQIK